MNRRSIVLTTGGVLIGAGALAAMNRNALTRLALSGRSNDGVNLSSASPEVPECRLTPEQIEGPFFLSAPVRADIREDRQGLPLELELFITRKDGCGPVEGALAEIWHCDNAGRYSGYPEDLSRRPFDTLQFLAGPNEHVEPVNGKMYLRGGQFSNAAGSLRFHTILPGWYEPRIPHIHLKVTLAERTAVTTQLYFPESLTTAIYREHPLYAP